MFSDVSFNDFVGKRVENVFINSDKHTMAWKVDGKWYEVDAVGDCCSVSWFEHCDNADAFRDATLLEYENTAGEGFEQDYDYIQVNMLKFKTDKGHCTIEFRNESNGYYSGWCELRECSEPNLSQFKQMSDF